MQDFQLLCLGFLVVGAGGLEFDKIDDVAMRNRIDVGIRGGFGGILAQTIDAQHNVGAAQTDDIRAEIVGSFPCTGVGPQGSVLIVGGCIKALHCYGAIRIVEHGTRGVLRVQNPVARQFQTI